MSIGSLKKIIESLKDSDVDNLDIMVESYNTPGVITDVYSIEFVEVKKEDEYIWSEGETSKLPIGMKFLKITFFPTGEVNHDG